MKTAGSWNRVYHFAPTKRRKTRIVMIKANKMASFSDPPRACGHRLEDTGSSLVNKCAAKTTSAADENIRLLSPPWQQQPLDLHIPGYWIRQWKHRRSQHSAGLEVEEMSGGSCGCDSEISLVKSWTFGVKKKNHTTKPKKSHLNF